MPSLSIMLTFLLLLIAILPQPDGVLRESCDLIEVNHFYDECGRLVFDQAIFWDWCDAESRFHVRAWRMVKSPSQIPQQNWLTTPGRGVAGCDSGGTTGRLFTTTWVDGEVIWQVIAAESRETWTQYDPELLQRETLPQEKRRGLKTK